MNERPDLTNATNAQTQTRNAGIDALRAATTFLVVLHHTAITYGATGSWYYKEISSDGSPSSMLLASFCTVNQAWFMGLFFLLAGYYTPGALQAKGPWRYLRDRLERLGVPLLVYGFVIGPATIALAETARGRPFGETLLWSWGQGRFEVGPLWFAWALLVFAVCAMLWRAVGRHLALPDPECAFPANSALLALALATGVIAFALRLQWTVDTEVWGLRLGYFASYVALFAAGCLSASPRWLERLPSGPVRTWRRIAWVALPVMPVVMSLGDIFPSIQGEPEGGWNFAALVYAFWEPLIAWGVILTLLRHSQIRYRELGPLGIKLARRAFAIYVIHPPLVVAVTLAARDIEASALLKFALSGSIACVLCYGAAGLLLSMPGVKRVL